MFDEVAALLRGVAQQVVLPRFRHLDAAEVVEKEPGELVTVADREAEALLVTGLTGLLPGSTVVGEEGVAADPALVERLADDGAVWLVDPVDGTRNFAEGRTPFAMMVALRRAGRTVAAWILDPVADSLAVAEAGGGAYIDGVRVHARGDAPGADALRGLLLTRYLPSPLRGEVATRSAALGATLPGFHCAGAEYPAVVDGRRDFVLFWRTMPWDHVPGALILGEAGGVVRRPDGSVYAPGDGRSGLLIAANPDIWRTVQETVFPS